MKMHHIGIAADDIPRMIEYTKNFFTIADISETVYDPNQKAYLCMLTTDTGLQIELIKGPMVEKLVKKRQYLYHICYEVEHIEEAVKKYRELGCFIVSEPKKTVLFHGKKVAFLMTDMGLIELVEAVS